MAEDEVLTYLQMLSREELLPAKPSAIPLHLIEQDRYSPLIRSTTMGIGAAHWWPSQRWDDVQWHEYLSRPHLRHWLALVDNAPAGLLSLNAVPRGEVEIDTFGLLPAQLGRGLGGHFLTVAVQLAWDVSPSVSRMWLHASSRDHPTAPHNYERRGFRRYQPDARHAARGHMP